MSGQQQIKQTSKNFSAYGLAKDATTRRTFNFVETMSVRIPPGEARSKSLYNVLL